MVKIYIMLLLIQGVYFTMSLNTEFLAVASSHTETFGIRF